MAKFEVITIGGAVRDIIFYTNQGKLFATPNNLTAQKMLAFEYGAKINAPEAYYNLGGGAANTAVTFARLNFKTAVVARLGRDQDAHDICQGFKKEKIARDFVQIDPAVHTGSSFIIAINKKDREHVAFMDRGANNNLAFPPTKQKRLDANWFYLTSFSGDQWLKSLTAFFKFTKTKKRKIKIAWNPGNLQLQAGQKILAPFLKQTEVLILNKDEAIELVLSGIKIGRRHPRYLNRPLYLLNILKDWGPKLVVVTAGEQGAWVFDGKKIYRQKIKKGKVVDTTGVGDAFGSAFVAGLIRHHGRIDQALIWGMLNAAGVCGQVGAQNGILTLNELKRKL